MLNPHRLGIVALSMSRDGGGITPVARAQALAVYHRHRWDVQVMGIDDPHAREDLHLWEPLSPFLGPAWGSGSSSISPGLTRHLLTSSVELVHKHGLWDYASVAVNRWHRKTRRPYLISLHGMLNRLALARSRWKKRLAWPLFERRHLGRAACLHALSHQEARAARSFGLKNPIAVIPNGVDLPDAITQPPPAWSSAGGGNLRTLLYIGRFHPIKGLEQLIRGFGLARQQGFGDDWQLVLAGWDQGGHKADLQRLVTDLGLIAQVQFLGPLYGDAKQAALHHAEGFVLPSTSEGQPVAVLEAWSFGLPVLMTPECNLPIGFEHQAAVQIETNAAATARGLHQFFQLNDGERRVMGQRGQQLVTAMFTWDKVCDSLVDVYRWILGESPPPDTLLTDGTRQQ